jgi:hypothetical protein
MSEILTPAMVERRLYELSKEVDRAQQMLSEAEMEVARIGADYELSMARSRTYLSNGDKKLTERQKQDYALVENEQLFRESLIADAKVRVAGSIRAQSRLR